MPCSFLFRLRGYSCFFEKNLDYALSNAYCVLQEWENEDYKQNSRTYLMMMLSKNAYYPTVTDAQE